MTKEKEVKTCQNCPVKSRAIASPVQASLYGARIPRSGIKIMTETRQCQNCKNQFTIEPDDFAFYEKINVPAPTWCPECRLQRRFLYRNERALYKRKCSATGKDVISNYSPDGRIVVYDHNYWWSDKWDATGYGLVYDFSHPFFEQFKELMKKVPQQNLMNKNAVNSEYSNWSANVKNSYLVFGGHDLEDCFYVQQSAFVKNCVDMSVSRNQEYCYETVDCGGNYQTFFSQHSIGCHHSIFLYDCRNCSDCFGCVNLRNKSHCFFNEQYSSEEYKKRLEDILGSYKKLLEARQKFEELKMKYIRRYAMITKSVNVSGDNINNAKNCHNCFYALNNVENGKHSFYFVDNAKDSYDVCQCGMNAELNYESISVVRSSNVRFTLQVWDDYNIQYSFNCHDSSNLFSCVGLRNKQYCILNKQYSKEEYEELVPKIIKHMNDMPYVDKKGRIYKYGEFFPPELSPFAYNETIAQEYFPLTKEQAIEQGYSWKDPEPRHYTITMTYDQLPDHIKDVPDSITEEIIGCSHEEKCNEQCTQAFKIIPDELQFYRKMNLPLPRLCPNCRHYQRLKQRNPLKLWHRRCTCNGATSSWHLAASQYQNTIKHFHGDQPCPNEFETSYAPDRPEIVYCEACYNQEVV